MLVASPVTVFPSCVAGVKRWRARATFPALTVLLPLSSLAADLTNLSLEQLLQLGVVGASKYEQSQSRTAAAVSIITRQDIATFGWRTLAEALASLPGMHLTYNRQYSYIGTRGFGLPGDFNTRLLVTLDGLRVNDPAYDGGPVGRQFPLDMDLVERIEFIPGPGGAVHGQNAMLGVVNVITRRGDDVAGTEIALGWEAPQRTGTARASWGHRFDNGLQALLSVSGLRSRGEDLYYDFGGAGVAGLAKGLDAEHSNSLLASLGQGPWTLELAHANRRKDDPTGGYHSDPLVPGQYQADGYSLAQFQYQPPLEAQGLTLGARVFAGQERYRSILNYGGSFSFPETSDWYGLETRVVSTLWADHTVLLGLEAQRNVRYDQAVLDLDHPENNLYIPGSGYRVGLFMQDEWQFAPALTATAGLRLDRNSTTGASMSPRLALLWQARPDTVVKTLYGRAHRPPNTFERDYEDGVSQIPNPALRGEDIDTLELVADHRVDQDLSLRASAYRWVMHDVIRLATDATTGLTQYQSSGKVQAKGLELSVDKTWDGGGRLRASLSGQSTVDDHGAALQNSPRGLARLNLSQPLPWQDLRLGYEWQWDGPRLTPAGSSLPSYALSHLQLSTPSWLPGTLVSLRVHNLLDKRYAQPGSAANWQNALQQDGRSVSLRLSARF
jgi:outer membrane receptor protein involved in Fe transport